MNFSQSSETSFDRTDPVEIFEYSGGIIGHTLHELFGDAVVEHARKGKGRLGQMVEEVFFGYEVNSDRNADFKDAALELKCTPLLESRSDGGYRIKERLVCTMIDYFELVNTSFEDSHLLRKCRLMLLLFYLHVNGIPAYDYKFLFRVLWNLPEKDLLVIKKDYETIAEKVRRGEAHLLSEGDTLYLGACRKGQKGDKLQSQPNSSEKAKKRAFSLKPAYMRQLLQHVAGSANRSYSNYVLPGRASFELVSAEKLKTSSFEQIILDRFAPFLGMNYVEICRELGIEAYQSKSKYADVAGLIASDNVSKRLANADEFVKSGLTLKTIRVGANGMPEESMSFKNIDYCEVADNGEWEESETYELFTSRFLFAVFREKPGEDIEVRNRKKQVPVKETSYVLDGVFFWTMPADDLVTAKEYWNNIRENVLKNDICLEAFWHIGDNRKFHVRPKGVKKSYRMAAINPNGGFADKYCYWFNAGYVKCVIENEGK